MPLLVRHTLSNKSNTHDNEGALNSLDVNNSTVNNKENLKEYKERRMVAHRTLQHVTQVAVYHTPHTATCDSSFQWSLKASLGLSTDHWGIVKTRQVFKPSSSKRLKQHPPPVDPK